MKNKTFHIVGTIPKSNITMVERCQIDTPNTQIHDRSISRLVTGTSIKCCGVNLVLWAQICNLSEMIQSCKCFPHVIININFSWRTQLHFVADIKHRFIKALLCSIFFADSSMHFLLIIHFYDQKKKNHVMRFIFLFLISLNNNIDDTTAS